MSTQIAEQNPDMWEDAQDAAPMEDIEFGGYSEEGEQVWAPWLTENNFMNHDICQLGEPWLIQEVLVMEIELRDDREEFINFGNSECYVDENPLEEFLNFQ